VQAEKDIKVERQSDDAVRSLDLNIPGRSARDRDLKNPYNGNDLFVPVNALAESKAREWIKSDDAQMRANGIAVLANFKSDENIAALKTLLTDPEGQWQTQNGQEIREYHIRAAALAALKEWGVEATAVVRQTIPQKNP